MAGGEMRRWAIRGAEQRLLEIGAEAARIYAAFPELRDRQVATPARRGPGRPRKTDSAPVRKRRKMSRAARKRISEAQKAREATIGARGVSAEASPASRKKR